MILKGAPILLLDEATSSPISDAGRKVQAALSELMIRGGLYAGLTGQQFGNDAGTAGVERAAE